MQKYHLHNFYSPTQTACTIIFEILWTAPMTYRQQLHLQNLRHNNIFFERWLWGSSPNTRSGRPTKNPSHLRYFCIKFSDYWRDLSFHYESEAHKPSIWNLAEMSGAFHVRCCPRFLNGRHVIKLCSYLKRSAESSVPSRLVARLIPGPFSPPPKMYLCSFHRSFEFVRLETTK